MVVAVAKVALHLPLLLLLRHAAPRLRADALTAGRLGHLGEQALGGARSVARVRHEHRVLAQPVKADVVGRRHVGLLPRALTVHALVLLLPQREEAARVGEELLLDLLRELLSGAAGRERGATHDNVDGCARRIVRLYLRVGGEQPETPLGRLVEPEGDDAGSEGDAKRGDHLAGDRALAAHPAHLLLARLRHHRLLRTR